MTAILNIGFGIYSIAATVVLLKDLSALTVLPGWITWVMAVVALLIFVLLVRSVELNLLYEVFS